MTGVARQLAEWAIAFEPSPADLDIADRSLVDVVAVTLAARTDAICGIVSGLHEASQWSAIGHVLDFDDLHMASTTHISVVCVPAALSCGGGARAYLAGAGVMARIGTMLGWRHYSAGWHATCTAGAPAAAVAAAVALGLDAEQTARAIALAVPAAGGVQRAFGTQAKSLQVGFATAAGVRAAHLAAAGASADVSAVDQWLALVGADATVPVADGEAIPGGLAIKLHPCCYAMQRPIAAVREAAVEATAVERVVVRTPAGTVQPLLHSRPQTGLEGKFSLEYGVAAALLDGYPDFSSFSDEAVRRAEAVRLLGTVAAELTPGGQDLLAGTCAVDIHLADGSTVSAEVAVPPGAPARPPAPQDIAEKVRVCVGELAQEVLASDWKTAVPLLRRELTPSAQMAAGTG